ncbi:hypothetical protein A8A54_19300 [Brucella pseudogrignonensis]|uniref:hypothetical protein n=1 Tax=Brucella pseudogrignonensis TaxID=419475 RepID=UPI0007DA49CA|nr:hypothetical protein [Brucella pseudogrignonensis]ANG98750.1 hypothetical protein A8A54_19300 [Brucella pseudogrignonensis]
MKKHFSGVGLAAVLALSLTGIASAHHGFSGRYDLSTPVWIEGEVVEAWFGQPHAELTLRISEDLALPSAPPDLETAANFLNVGSLRVLPETVGQVIEVELPPTRQYFGLGDRIKPGDRIAVIAVRNCEEPHQLNGQWLRLASGEIVARAGAMSYMVNGC